MKRLLKPLVPLFDILLLPFLLPAALVMRLFRRLPLRDMRLGRALLERLGVFPILGNYMEPPFKRSEIRLNPSADRSLPGLDLNVAWQLRLLREAFHYQAELAALPREKPAGGEPRFYYHNASFESGDAEFLYSFIRHAKPKTIIEIGCGSSTLMIQEAIRQNRAEQPGYACRHVCIEPFVSYWNTFLDRLPVEIVRQRVETMDLDLFRQLGPSDLLFIDSSHVIRAQGDVLFEYLQVLPILAPGVFVHIHDIFTPRDYSSLWRQELPFSNEQYLLEAFLTNNSAFEVTGALNYLARHHRSDLAKALPVFGEEEGREPGSFWIRRVA